MAAHLPSRGPADSRTRKALETKLSRWKCILPRRVWTVKETLWSSFSNETHFVEDGQGSGGAFYETSTRVKSIANLPGACVSILTGVQVDAEPCALGWEGLGSSPGLRPFLHLHPWTSYSSPPSSIWKTWLIIIPAIDLTLQPHGLESARLLCPCDSPGKNPGVGRHSLLQGIFATQDRTRVSCIAGRFFFLPSEPPGKNNNNVPASIY